MLDIVMVTYRSERFERVALETLARNTDVEYRLRLIDNVAPNQSLTSVWNAYARSSSAAYVCFVNPDVIFARRWASRLMRAFNVPGVVIATPSTPSAAGSPVQRIDDSMLVHPVRTLTATWRAAASTAPIWWKSVISAAATKAMTICLDQLSDRRRATIVNDPYSVGFCYCVDLSWLKSVGFFDEVTFPFYGQETDLNFRAFAHGKRAVCVPNSVVFHHGHGSHESERTGEYTQVLQKCFRELKARWPSWEHQA